MAWTDGLQHSNGSGSIVYAQHQNIQAMVMRGNYIIDLATNGGEVTANVSSDLTTSQNDVDIADVDTFNNGAERNLSSISSKDLSTEYALLSAGQSLYVLIYVNSSGTVTKSNGNAASSGQQLPPEVPENSVPLALVTLTYGDTTVDAADIEDWRHEGPQGGHFNGIVKVEDDIYLQGNDIVLNGSNTLSNAELDDLHQIVNGGLNVDVVATSLNNIGGLSVDLGSLTATAAELNVLDGINVDVDVTDFNKLADITASAAELNVLDGISGVTTANINNIGSLTVDLGTLTATATELNKLAGASVTTAELDILSGVNGDVTTASLNNIGGLGVDLDNLTATAAELNVLDGIVGVTTANINNIGDLTVDLGTLTATASELNILDGATVTTAELNILDNATLTTAELNILAGATVTTAELNQLDGNIFTADIDINSNGIKDGVNWTLTATELGYLNDGIGANFANMTNTIWGYLDGLGYDIGGISNWSKIESVFDNTYTASNRLVARDTTGTTAGNLDTGSTETIFDSTETLVPAVTNRRIQMKENANFSVNINTTDADAQYRFSLQVSEDGSTEWTTVDSLDTYVATTGDKGTLTLTPSDVTTDVGVALKVKFTATLLQGSGIVRYQITDDAAYDYWECFDIVAV